MRRAPKPDPACSDESFLRRDPSRARLHGAPVVLESVHDVRLVRPSADARGSPVVDCGFDFVGHCAVRISAAGAGEPDRLHGDVARPAQDPAGADHADRVRPVRDAVHGRDVQARLRVGRLVHAGRGVFHVPDLALRRVMHLHILGICGTFMGGIAALARRAGHTVTGCDANVYPPMSTQLAGIGVALTDGFDPAQLDTVARDADVFVVGNVVSRGNPLMEAVMSRGLHYVSGPQWLFDQVLRTKWVLAVAGTHGKTSTAAMLVHILERAGLDPGYLIGGVPMDTGVSARLTDSTFFVIEADEYDTAFFDKRSKFVHYRPKTAVLNNLEFDHAD